ncbi:hypothetical protein [Cellulomonas sp. S1-8]|uniref:hypothetical protein n=1 Tax=Cellulomonas sp. S1-8 TaxID=2904790 RepID=UPI00224306EA|nr:hypothetical protein [Cellulomonas sp. S1-8]UZN01965.1 hypothetical protein OKX07_12805 [Cellulomonas sp. S1-8]
MRRSTITEHAAAPLSRHERSRTARRRRTRRRVGALLAVVVTVATALPAAAAIDDQTPAGPTVLQDTDGTGTLPGGGTRPQATIEDEDAWCSYLSSSYLSFPSPWSARVINCRDSDLFVAPVYSDGGLGMCVLVPARHSRHLGGSITRWVTDIRYC